MSNLFDAPGDYGYPMVDLDSDDNFDDKASSEDDLDIILYGTPEQKRRLRRISLGQNSSSEDEFEKEMGEELSEAMNKLRDSAKIKASPSRPETSETSEGNKADTSAKSEEKKPEEKFYNNEYFDSDSDEDGNSTGNEKKKSKHPMMTNDDLFYDPDMDREDELWVQGQRNYQGTNNPNNPKKKKPGEKKPKAAPRSDAVLNCPACMSLLCLDCQRHDIYKNQYRAMFVKNCTVNMSERLRYPAAKNNKKKRKKVQLKSPLEDLEAVDSGEGERRGEVTMETTDCGVGTEAGAGAGTGEESTSSLRTEKDEVFYPVKCEVCSSEVGVFDEDEVYHFFNVLASHA